MNVKRNSMLLIILAVSLTFSCKTTQVPDAAEQKQEAKAAASLDELYGIWLSASGSSYEYPFVYNNIRYLKKSSAETDDTYLWQDFARKSGISLLQLWSKRFAYVSKIYSENLPSSDSSGIEKGVKLRLIGGHIYAKREWLIPERILSFNLNFFMLEPSMNQFTENGTFHFASSKFKDISGNELYTKQISSPKAFNGTSL